MSLPGTYIYLSSLVFLFFNFCLPVAVIRVLTSLEKQSQLNREQSKKLSTLVKRYLEIFNNGGTPSFFCNQQGKILHANKSGRKLMQNSQPDCSFIYELFALTKPLVAEESEIAALRSDPDTIYKIQPASLVHHKKQLIHCFDISHTTAADKKIGLLRRKHFTRHYSDALTELKNHHYWSHEFPQSLEHDHTVILLKLANLKDINLQYSFSVGDQVLTNVAALLRNQLSSSVNLYRFPGAKFLLCVDTDQSSTENIQDWLNRHLPATIIQPMEKGKDEILINLQWRSGYCNTSGFTSAALLAEACAIALSQTTQSHPFEQYDSKVVKLIR